MSIFQCQNCGCAENTACSNQMFSEWSDNRDLYDWSYAPERKGLNLCRACGPTHYGSGNKIEADHWGDYGQWHGVFERKYFPHGEMITNRVGNLEHKETGLTGEEMRTKFARAEPYPQK